MFPLLSLMMLSVWVAVQNDLPADRPVQDHKGKPAVEVLEMKARRNEDLIELAAQIKNINGKPLRNLQVIFLFQDSGGGPVSTEEMNIDEQRLLPDAEASVTVQLKDAPRATQVRIGAEASGGVELTVKNSGPYPIE